MAIWAYECNPCKGSGTWMVSRELVDALPAGTNILRVKAGAEWRCARVSRGRQVQVEAMLLRAAEASDGDDCPECTAVHQTGDDSEPTLKSGASAQVQAAAISIQGHHMLVVLVPLALASSAGEADMLIADLRPRFGNVDLLLMGQEDDGTPRYHGDAELVALVVDLPIDKMPWKNYSAG